MTPDQIKGDLREGDVYVTEEEAKKIALVLKVRHRWLWRGLFAWIFIFSVIVFYALHENRASSNATRRASASVADLQKTNCNLKTFLLNAKTARLRDADAVEQQADRASNLSSARGYVVLANNIEAVGNCQIPAKLLRPVPAK